MISKKRHFAWVAYLTLGVLALPSCDLLQKLDPSASNNSSSIGSDGSGGSGGGGTGTQTSPPAAPTSLTGGSTASNTINLSWTSPPNPNGTFLANIYVQRAPLNSGPFVSTTGTFVTIATLQPNVTTYSDTTLAASTAYYYQVLANNAAGDSQPSNEVEIQTQSTPVNPPGAPTLLSASSPAATLVNLSWTNNASNAGSFKIYRSTGGGAFNEIAIASSNDTTFQDYNLLASTSYMYKVTASNIAGESAPTNTASVTTLAAGNTDTFTYVNTNIITPNCVDCHNSQNAAGGVNLSTAGGLSSNASKAYSDMQSGKMPPGGGMTSLQLSQMDAWIISGAPTNN
jgi:hypothetical protein